MSTLITNKQRTFLARMTAGAFVRRNASYVDLNMEEWRAREWPRRIQRSVRRVLGELCAETLPILRNEPKLEVMVRSDAKHSVWANFSMHPRLHYQYRSPAVWPSCSAP
jgi:hypothetical protein